MNRKCAAFRKYSGRFPDLVTSAHSSLITMASAVTSGDTGWCSQLHAGTDRWLSRSLSHHSSPGEGYDFQGKDVDAQQEGGKDGGNIKLLHWELQEDT